MTDREREAMERLHPDTLREYERGDPGAADWFNANRTALSEWASRQTPESFHQRWERERQRKENEGAGGW